MQRFPRCLSVACFFCWYIHCPICMQRCILHACVPVSSHAHGFSQMILYEDAHVPVALFFLPTMLHAQTSTSFSYSKYSLNTIRRVVLNYSEERTGSAKVLFRILKGRIYLSSAFLLPALLVCICRLSFETTTTRNLMLVLERKTWKASGWSSNFRSWNCWEKPYPCSHRALIELLNRQYQ